MTPAEKVAEVAAAHAAEGETARRLADPVVGAIRASGLLSLCVPKSLGGSEATALEFVEAIEAVSYGDGSAGWTLMIGATTGVLSASLAPPVARSIFTSPDVLTVGVMLPGGKADEVDGGHCVSGRWSWGSGGVHSDWIVGGAALADGSMHVMFFPRADVAVLDTWAPPGLRGTASNDFTVDGVIVPAGRSVLVGGQPVAEGPLYTFPTLGLLALGVASVPLGLARRALDEFRSIAVDRIPMGSTRPLAERPSAQRVVAEAEALVGSGRAWMTSRISEAWERASRGERLDRDHRAGLRLAAVHATWQAARAIDLLYHTAGGASAQPEGMALARCFRDVHVATQHAMVSERMLETVGRHRLGMESTGL